MREIISNNFWWKLTALCLAVLAWFGFQPREMRPFSLLIREAVDLSLLFYYFNLNSFGDHPHEVNPARRNIDMNFH